MKKSDFNYDLPEELIAQTPVEPRNHSRLMKIDRASGEGYFPQGYTAKKRGREALLNFCCLSKEGISCGK